MNPLFLNLSLPDHAKILSGTILRLGYPGPEAVTKNISIQIGQGIETCLELARAKETHHTTAFTGLDKTAIRGDGLCLETVNWTRLAARMSGIRELCGFAVTLGKAVDERIKKQGKTAMLQALMLDAAASVLADLYADQVQQQINHHYRQQGLQSSVRFSPGYCDWPMKEGQATLVPFLDPASIGISASDTGLMTPRKSITAVVIAAEQMPAESPCFLCVRECPHRRAPYAGKKDSPQNV